MGKAVFCDQCTKEIKRKSDLVVATVIFYVVPYCSKCYVDQIKGVSSFVVDNTPLNGEYSDIVTGIVAIAFILTLFLNDPIKYLLLAGFGVIISYRLYSYLTYEPSCRIIRTAVL